MGESPVEALWLALALSLPLQTRASLGDLVVGVRGRSARWLRAGERTAPIAEADTRSAQAEVLRGLDPAELVLCAVEAPEPVDWWLRVGRHIPLAVDGRLLLRQGVRPGRRMGDAIAAARAAAWDGGDPQAQLDAAMKVLRG